MKNFSNYLHSKNETQYQKKILLSSILLSILSNLSQKQESVWVTSRCVQKRENRKNPRQNIYPISFPTSYGFIHPAISPLCVHQYISISISLWMLVIVQWHQRINVSHPLYQKTKVASELPGICIPLYTVSDILYYIYTTKYTLVRSVINTDGRLEGHSSAGRIGYSF